MTLIDWTDRDLDLPTVTDADLDAVEAERKVRLPEDFRAILKQHAGQVPGPCVSTVGRAEVPAAELFFARRNTAERHAYNLWHYLEAFDSHLPADMARGLIPFTSNSGHAIFALDFHSGEPPAVVLVDLENAEDPDRVLTVIAPSFGQWLGGLHD